MSDPLHFSVHGFGFALEGSSRHAIDGLADDFAFFAGGAAAAAVTLQLDEGRPDYGGLPRCDAAVYTPRNVVYHDGTRRILDFGGHGLGVYDPAARRFHMTSENPHLVYEAGYLFLLSQIGQHADLLGLHRVHAMAISRSGRAVLALLPMGGGKSTLLAALMRISDVGVLSDDSPFIDRRGDVHAFPLRLGLLPGCERDLPPEQVRRIERMEFGPKYLVNHAYFADRVVPRAEPGVVLIGRRTLADEGRLEPASYQTAMQAMVPHSIIGMGLFQGLEYVLQRNSRELLGKMNVAWSRARNAHALVRRSRCFVFHMGRDVERNAALVLEASERAAQEA
jgi:hypothetical protein